MTGELPEPEDGALTGLLVWMLIGAASGFLWGLGLGWLLWG